MITLILPLILLLGAGVLLYHNIKLRRQLHSLRSPVQKNEATGAFHRDFLANIGHAIKNPLLILIAHLENEIQKSSEPPNSNLLLIKKQASRLTSLADQIGDLNKLESGAVFIRLKQANLRNMLTQTVASFEVVANSRGVRFEKNYELDDKVYWFDQDKLDKIFTNLLNYCFQAAPVGSVVSFRARQQKDGFLNVNLAYSNENVGVSAENIFFPFYRTAGAVAGPEPGLGLPLVKELVKVYNGSIFFQTGRGRNNFDLTLPISKKHFAPERLLEDGPEIFITHPTLAADAEFLIGSNVNSQQDELLVCKNLILVIDHNADAQQLIAATLQNANYAVITARESGEGIALAKKYVPCLILGELNMPEKDGIEITRDLRKDPTTSHIPVILFVTARDHVSTIEGTSSGVDDFLVKPFSPMELTVRTRNLIDQRIRLQENFLEQAMTRHDMADELSIDEKFIQKVKEVVETNMADHNFSVEKMSEEMGLSRTQLLRKLKALTGLSPQEFIKKIRLTRAAQMIEQRLDTVTQIGYAVGFNDQSYFTKCFKKQYGIPPSEYLQPASRKKMTASNTSEVNTR